MSEGEGGTLADTNKETLEHATGGIGIADKAFGLAEGFGVGEMLHHAAPLAMPAIGAFLGPLGALAGGVEVLDGVEKCDHGDTGGGVVTALQGMAGMVGGAGSALGATATSMGYTGVGLGAMEAAGPVGAAAGVGLAAGTGMNAIANSDATRTGFWGKGLDGRNKSANDAAIDAAVDPSLQGDWTWGGAAQAMAGGVGAALISPFQAAANLAGSAVDTVSGGASVIGSSFNQLAGGAGRPSGY